MISRNRCGVARKHGERLAAGGETAIEHIGKVVASLIRAGDEKLVRISIVQLMFGMLSPVVFNAM